MQCCHIGRVSVQLTLRKTTPRTCRLATDQCQSQRCGGAFEGRAPPTFTHLADACIQSDLQLHSDYTFSLVCVPWESNPQPFALLTQCSTTEPHRNPLAVIVPLLPQAMAWPNIYIYIYIYIFYIKCTNCNLHGIKWNERGKHIILVVHDMLLGLAIIGQCLLVAE